MSEIVTLWSAGCRYHLFGVLLREPASFHDIQVSQTAHWRAASCSSVQQLLVGCHVAGSRSLGTLAGVLATVFRPGFCMASHTRCCCLLRTAGAWAANQQADK
jgi:hypothetical protein